MNSTLALRRRTLQLPARRSLLPTLAFLAAVGLLWFILCRDLSLEWSSNEQYSYGWFVPFFAAFLFWLRLESKGKSEKEEVERKSSGQLPNFLLYTLAFLLLAALLPIRLFEVANPDWRPLSWIHAMTVVGYSLLVIGYWGGMPAVRHFAFPVCFILVAVPWPTPIEAPLVNGLMRLVAAVATETLTLFGIPAQLEGSLIRTANGVVGVSEACSGVRSLQTSLMIGLLFGELKRLTISRRFALVAAALTIALLANFGRTIFLVWIAATQNLAAVERWHDFAGYAIVGVVFLGTLAIASALAKVKSRRSKVERDSSSEATASSLRSPTSALRLPPTIFFLSTLAFLLCAEGAVSAWYRWHERDLVPTKRWSVQWPEQAPGFRPLPIDQHTREMLRYDHGRQACWIVSDLVRPNPTEPAPNSPIEKAARAYLFSFRWEPGAATVLRARAHRPDICLPAVGWRQTNDAETRSYAVSDRLRLPFQHLSFVHDETDGRSIHAETFFCLTEDRVPAARADDNETIPSSHWSIPERWKAVRDGVRNPGQQVLEFVLLSRQKLTPVEAENEFAQLVRNLVKEEGGG